MNTKSKQSPKFKVGDIVYTCSPINVVVEKRGPIVAIDQTPCCGPFFYHFSGNVRDYEIESQCFETKQEAAKHRIEFFKQNLDFSKRNIKFEMEKIKSYKKMIAKLQKVVDNQG